MVQIKNTLHAIRRQPWAILLPIIFIIQLLLMFGFSTSPFATAMLGWNFWLIGYFLLIAFSVCMIPHNKWSILPVFLFLSIPVLFGMLFVLPIPLADIVIHWYFLFIFLAANILTLFVARIQKAKGPRFIATASLFIFLMLVLMIPSYYIGTYPIRLDIQNAKLQAQVVIDKVDAYYQTHQRYPESLTELGYEKDHIPLKGLILPLHYIKDHDHYYFEFADPLGFINYLQYHSDTRQWKSD